MPQNGEITMATSLSDCLRSIKRSRELDDLKAEAGRLGAECEVNRKAGSWSDGDVRKYANAHLAHLETKRILTAHERVEIRKSMLGRAGVAEY